MSPRFEEALARLYVDDTAFEQFENAPQALFEALHLTPEERCALEAVDRTALRVARESFRTKRDSARRGRIGVRDRIRRLLGVRPS